MRISDRSLQSSFLRNISLTRERLASVEEKVTKESKINRPSDSPLGTSRVMRLENQLQNIETYKSNISRSKSLVNSTINSMDGMLSAIEKVLSDIASSNDATLGTSSETYAANIDSALSQILEMANSEFDGNYLFSGTDHSNAPFAINSAGSVVTAQNSDIGGQLDVKISKTLEQKVNISGKELFQSVLTDRGNFDSAQVVGAGPPFNSSTAFTSDTKQIYNADGTEYTLTTYYSKTAANTYQLDFEVDDGSGAINAGSSTLEFNATTGELTSVDGGSVSDIQIQLGGEKIDMLVDVSNMTESASATNFNKTMNQKTDIFNTLIAVRDQIRAGTGVEDNQVEVIEDFHTLLLDKMSAAGSISNRLEDTEILLNNQDLEVKDLLSKEKDVDTVKAWLDIENHKYTLDLSYKISSMILPKSIMDFI